MQQAADPMQILQRDRLVEPELALQIGLVGGIDHAGGIEQDVDDVAGHDAQQDEDDDRDPDQGQEHQGEAAHDIGKHRLLPISVSSTFSAHLSSHTFS